MNLNEKIYRNVKALAAINGMNLRDIEINSGLYPGYFSRIKKRGISLDAAMNVSKELDVQMDELMNGDYEHELEKKIAMDELASAICRASEFYNEDGLIQFLRNMIHERKNIK